MAQENQHLWAGNFMANSSNLGHSEPWANAAISRPALPSFGESFGPPPIAAESHDSMYQMLPGPLPQFPQLMPQPHQPFQQGAHLSKVAYPAVKVAGSRIATDAKGKARAKTKRSADSSSKKQRGRGAGTTNYSSADVDALLDLLEEHLPLGGHAWNMVGDEFVKWAEENGRPSRTAKSLELKFKQLVRTTKPTGDAECPPEIERAHTIESAMNERAGTKDLDDEDIVDAEVVEISSDEEVASQPKNAQRSTAPVARRIPASTRPRGNPAHEVLKSITNALDPNVHEARNSERSMYTFQTAQIFALNNQLRDTQAMLETLRDRLSASERERNAAERRADRMELVSLVRKGHAKPPRPHKRRRRQDVTYGDGGSAVIWIGSSESDHARDSPETRRYTHVDETISDAGSHDTGGSPARYSSPPTDRYVPPIAGSSSSL